MEKSPQLESSDKNKSGLTAILLGATGLTGGHLLQLLLNDHKYSKIILFSRSSVSITHPKIEEHLMDLFKLKDYKNQFKADHVFCCIGTTKSKTPDDEIYKKIDFGIPVDAAKISKENEIDTFIVISALGANANSKVFYNRIKGEMENEVLSQKIKNTYLIQPALISGERNESRFFENLAKQSFKLLNPILVGSLKKYQSIHPKVIARAMHKIALNGYGKSRIPSDEIKEIAG